MKENFKQNKRIRSVPLLSAEYFPEWIPACSICLPLLLFTTVAEKCKILLEHKNVFQSQKKSFKTQKNSFKRKKLFQTQKNSFKTQKNCFKRKKSFKRKKNV